MKTRKIQNVVLARLDKGDEIIKSLTEFCEREGIKTGMVRGIGAVSEAGIAYFDTSGKKYKEKIFKNGSFELTSLEGNITLKDKKPFLHLHVTISDQDFNAYGGHLNYAIISLTGEIFITPLDVEIERKPNAELGINTMLIA